jgi:hypothetical protein
MDQQNRYQAEFKAQTLDNASTIMMISDSSEEDLLARSVGLLEAVFTNAVCEIKDCTTGQVIKKLKRTPEE